MEYRVRNIIHLNNIIIPFFKKNNLLTVKKFDFEDFCKIVDLINKGEHLTEEGLSKIQSIKLNMNLFRKL